MAEGVTVANAFVQIMPSTEGAQQSITESLVPQLDGAGQTGGASLGASLFGSLKSVFSGLFSAYAVTEMVEMIVEAGVEWQEATRELVVGTGATGDTLAALTDNVKSVSSSVATGFSDAAEITQNLNTRLGITGEELQGLSTQTAALGTLFGSGINVDTLTGMMNRWGITGAEMGETMDYLFRVTQSTGVTYDELTGSLEKNAAVYDSLGLNVEQAALLFGNLEKGGYNASTMLNALQSHISDLTEYGPTAAEGLQNVITQIRDLSSQGEEGAAAAQALAESIVGGRQAANLVSACNDGTLSLTDLDGALGDTSGAIMETYDSTATLKDEWATLGNNVKSYWQPATEAIADGLTSFVGWLNDAFTHTNDAVENSVTLAEANAARFGHVGTTAQQGMQPFSDYMAGMSDLVSGAFSSIDENRIENDLRKAAQSAKSAWTSNFTATGVININGQQTNLGQIRWFADGGILNRATIFGAGEAGPEMVMPLSGPQYENVTSDIADKVDSGAEVVEWLSSNLPRIISTYTPTMTKREFSRAVSAIV